MAPVAKGGFPPPTGNLDLDKKRKFGRKTESHKTVAPQSSDEDRSQLSMHIAIARVSIPPFAVYYTAANPPPLRPEGTVHGA